MFKLLVLLGILISQHCFGARVIEVAGHLREFCKPSGKAHSKAPLEKAIFQKLSRCTEKLGLEEIVYTKTGLNFFYPAKDESFDGVEYYRFNLADCNFRGTREVIITTIYNAQEQVFNWNLAVLTLLCLHAIYSSGKRFVSVNSSIRASLIDALLEYTGLASPEYPLPGDDRMQALEELINRIEQRTKEGVAR